MKANRIHKVALLASLLMFGLLATGCGEDPAEPAPPPPAPPVIETDAFISGTVSLPVGLNVNLNNARAAVYDSQENFWNDAWIAQAAISGGGNTYSFVVGPLNPGTYYLDLWKDNNNNGHIDDGDYYGAYTTGSVLRPIQVLDGQTTPIHFTFSTNKAAEVESKGKWSLYHE